MTRWARALVGLALSSVTACSVNLDRNAAADIVKNQCTEPSDCGSGTCQSGACVAHDGKFSTMLLEIAPPLAAQGVGGVRFLQIATDLERSSEDAKIDLAPTSLVHGYVQGCDPDGFAAVKVTLTPREESYGLPAVTYVARTGDLTPVAAGHPCVHPPNINVGTPIREFIVAVPGGDSRYDVYVEPLSQSIPGDGGAGPACALVPQLLRNQRVNNQGAAAVVTCLGIVPTAPQSLDVKIPWPATATGTASLDGWVVDVVHPVTGHVLSNSVTLRSSDRGSPPTGPYERTDLRFAPVASEDPGKVLVRLSPPAGVLGPVIQAELSGLSAAYGTPGTGGLTKAVFPPFGPFPAPVTLDSWVYQRADSATPVSGNVSLTATSLDGIKAGIFASFSTTQVVGSDGKLRVPLLPGHYRARVVPDAGLGLAASESTIDVACEHDALVPNACATSGSAHSSDAGSSPRAGKVLLVSRAAQITGSVGNASSASVQALPSAPGARECGPGVDAAACAAAPLGVLDVSLGDDAFVPRPASAVMVGGHFALSDLDCGACPEPPGASFDVSVRPPDGSLFAWLLEPRVVVDGDVALDALSLPLPIIHRGVVEIPRTGADSVPVPSALIRAYLLLDDAGAAIESPTGLSSCASQLATGTPASTRCVRSVLQVAETRAAEDGTFQLVLPSSIQ